MTKSERRKEKVDDKYMEEMFSSVTSLYRLDQIVTSEGSGGKKDLGPLPAGSKALIGALVLAWVLIGLYVLRDYRQNKVKSGRK